MPTPSVHLESTHSPSDVTTAVAPRPIPRRRSWRRRRPPKRPAFRPRRGEDARLRLSDRRERTDRHRKPWAFSCTSCKRARGSSRSSIRRAAGGRAESRSLSSSSASSVVSDQRLPTITDRSVTFSTDRRRVCVEYARREPWQASLYDGYEKRTADRHETEDAFSRHVVGSDRRMRR